MITVKKELQYAMNTPLRISWLVAFVIIAILSITKADASATKCSKFYKPKAPSRKVDLTAEFRDLNEALAKEIIAIEADPAYEIRITGQELGADITEAMLANPAGFNHRDAEKAIIDNLGDLSEQATHYVTQSNLWHNSAELNTSMTEMNYATDDFLSASKSYKQLAMPNYFNRVLEMLPFGSKAELRQRRLNDLVQSLQISRHRNRIAREKLGTIMTTFETLNKAFAAHYVKMNRSIEILQSAISYIRLGHELDEDLKLRAISTLEIFLRNVTTSMTTSSFGLNALFLTFTNQDFAVKTRGSQINVAMDLMLNLGISANVLKDPFYVQEVLGKNKNVSIGIMNAVYSGKSPDDVIHAFWRTLAPKQFLLSTDEILVMLKLLPKGTSARAVNAWSELLPALSDYKDPSNGTAIFSNDGSKWVENNQSRSIDLGVLYLLLVHPMNSKPLTANARTKAIDPSEFLRFFDYVDDVIAASESLKIDGLNGKLKKSIRDYFLVLAKKRFAEIQAVLALEQGNK